ncbi:Crp/Fnr family transcriptional regulator [Inmirania thermothiophila]|uniref:CRP/FNR family transcriptional regulator n=1 Tax=Inmirania thermothiophila TaxID=1750597 RepID=A0A3N1Y4X2_9GAMM|nr:Crp/Fnr family transcriptional regulator [Inmirania thermothiophila]ROR32672.1 CRP/FNR family transcriptional regulator [Inmirania thermothiophila]
MPRALERACIDAFPQLAAVEPRSRDVLLAAARRVRLPAGTVVFREGEGCRSYLLVLDGTVRVQKVSESGREIVLYRVERGEGCVLTTTCLLASSRYPAEGVAETEVDAVAVPVHEFHRVLAESARFRELVFAVYARRVTELILLVEEVAFGRMDRRLAHRLLELAAGGARIEATHQALAAELGTAREVVSRLLKEFERHGWVALGRGWVEVRDPEALRRAAAGGLV